MSVYVCVPVFLCTAAECVSLSLCIHLSACVDLFACRCLISAPGNLPHLWVCAGCSTARSEIGLELLAHAVCKSDRREMLVRTERVTERDLREEMRRGECCCQTGLFSVQQRSFLSNFESLQAAMCLYDPLGSPWLQLPLWSWRWHHCTEYTGWSIGAICLRLQQHESINPQHSPATHCYKLVHNNIFN